MSEPPLEPNPGSRQNPEQNPPKNPEQNPPQNPLPMHELLPEDISSWPGNYWDLLGLRPGSDLRALRLSYSRLIKRFRPEHYPQQFQRIQQAYETLEELIRSGIENLPEIIENEEQLRDFIRSQSEAADSANDHPTHALSDAQMKSFLSELMQLIDRPDWTEAVGFLQKKMEDPAMGDLPWLYMFWLSYVKKDAKTEQERLQLLLDGDLHNNSSSHASNCIRVLLCYIHHQDHTPDSEILSWLAVHVQLRILPLILYQKWNRLFSVDISAPEAMALVEQDLELARNRFDSSPYDETSNWVVTLIAAMELMLWIDTPESQEQMAQYSTVVNKYIEHDSPFEELLNNLDRLVETFRSWKMIPHALPIDRDQLGIVIQISWSQPFTFYRYELITLLAPLTVDVLKTFMVFDYLNLHHQMVLLQLRLPIFTLFKSRHLEIISRPQLPVGEVILKLVEIWESSNSQYQQARLKILLYFFQTMIYHPPVYEAMAQAAGEYTKLHKLPADAPTELTEHTMDCLIKFLALLLKDTPILMTYYSIMASEMINEPDIN